MPVQVQLPGWHQGNAEGLASILNSGFNAYRSIKEGGVADAQKKNLDLQNQQTASDVAAKQNYMKAMTTPEGQEGSAAPNARVGALTQIDGYKGAGLGDPKFLDTLRNTVADPNKTPTGLSINQLMSPLHESLQPLLQAKLSGGAAAARAAAQTDSDSRSVAEGYHSALKDHKDTINSIGRIQSILNAKDEKGNPLITKQAIGEANLAVNSIFSPKHQSDSTVDATEYQSAPAEFMGALQRLSADPKDANSRKIVEHIVDQAHRIGNVTNTNAIRELDNLDASNRALTVPAAMATAKNTSSQYRKMFSTKYPERGENAAPGISALDHSQIKGMSRDEKIKHLQLLDSTTKAAGN